MSKTIEEMLSEMASVAEPFGLFEPHLFYGKLGDEQWCCSLNSVDARLFRVVECTTAEEAVRKCYEQAMDWYQREYEA
jgi:hypothetical protein